MKIIRLIVFSIFLALFMHISVTHNGKQNEELKPYVTEFVRIAKIFDYDFTNQGNSVTLVFGKTRDNEYAFSNRITNVITVSEDDWRRMNPANREELMFHELGHHFLDLDHSEYGIMKASELLGTYEYTTNYSYHINVLFGCQYGDCHDIIWEKDKYDQNNSSYFNDFKRKFSFIFK